MRKGTSRGVEAAAAREKFIYRWFENIVNREVLTHENAKVFDVVRGKGLGPRSGRDPLLEITGFGRENGGLVTVNAKTREVREFVYDGKGGGNRAKLVSAGSKVIGISTKGEVRDSAKTLDEYVIADGKEKW